MQKKAARALFAFLLTDRRYDTCIEYDSLPTTSRLDSCTYGCVGFEIGLVPFGEGAGLQTNLFGTGTGYLCRIT